MENKQQGRQLRHERKSNRRYGVAPPPGQLEALVWMYADNPKFSVSDLPNAAINPNGIMVGLVRLAKDARLI